MATLAAWSAALGYPKPATVPTRWELDFDPGPLRLYVDPGNAGAFWYFTYKVTNHTGKQKTWAPSLVVYTDAGELMHAGRGVPTRVTSDLRRLLGNPLLMSQNEIIGELLSGKENAKEGLAIWPAGSLQVNELSLFIAGISGETATVRNPLDGQEVVLRKTLKRDYLIPGEVAARGSQPVALVQQSWVMR